MVATALSRIKDGSGQRGAPPHPKGGFLRLHDLYSLMICRSAAVAASCAAALSLAVVGSGNLRAILATSSCSRPPAAVRRVISVATEVVSVIRFAPSEIPFHSFLALQRTLPRCIIDERLRYFAKPVLALSAGMP